MESRNDTAAHYCYSCMRTVYLNNGNFDKLIRGAVFCLPSDGDKEVIRLCQMLERTVYHYSLGARTLYRNSEIKISMRSLSIR